MNGRPIHAVRSSALLALGLAALTGACTAGLQESPAPSGVTLRTHPDTLVIVGTDAAHTMITEPLVEVLPVVEGVPALLRLAFESVEDRGIEGGIGFVSAYEPGGAKALDRIADLDGDVVELGGGEYSVQLYFRPCDGNCGLLDPPVEWCTLQHTFVAGAKYDITVTGKGFGLADCSLQEAVD